MTEDCRDPQRQPTELREKRRKRWWEGKTRRRRANQRQGEEKGGEEEGKGGEEGEEKKRRKKELYKLRRNLMVPTASELFSSGVEDCGGGALDEGRKNVKIFYRCCWKERGPRGFLVKAPALASQRKMSEQRRVLAGLGEDVERKKEVRKLLSKMFRSAHCPAFPSNCHNFSCLG